MINEKDYFYLLDLFKFEIKNRPTIKEYLIKYFEMFCLTERSSLDYLKHRIIKGAYLIGCDTTEEKENIIKYCIENDKTIETVFEEEFKKEEQETGTIVY